MAGQSRNPTVLIWSIPPEINAILKREGFEIQSQYHRTDLVTSDSGMTIVNEYVAGAAMSQSHCTDLVNSDHHRAADCHRPDYLGVAIPPD